MCKDQNVVFLQKQRVQVIQAAKLMEVVLVFRIFRLLLFLLRLWITRLCTWTYLSVNRLFCPAWSHESADGLLTKGFMNISLRNQTWKKHSPNNNYTKHFFCHNESATFPSVHQPLPTSPWLSVVFLTWIIYLFSFPSRLLPVIYSGLCSSGTITHSLTASCMFFKCYVFSWWSNNLLTYSSHLISSLSQQPWRYILKFNI